MTVQIFTDTKGRKKSVLLNYNDYQMLLEKADELACIQAYDKAKSTKQKFSTAKDVFARIESSRK
jgi:phage anti-repressor protein